MNIGTIMEKRKAIRKVIRVPMKMKMQEKYMRWRQLYLLQQAVKRAPSKAKKENRIKKP